MFEYSTITDENLKLFSFIIELVHIVKLKLNVSYKLILNM